MKHPMRNRTHLWSRFTPLHRWILVLGLVFAASALGTVLVTANGEDNRAALSDEAAAVALLGRSLPSIHDASVDLSRSGIGIDPASRPRRAVHVAYSLSGVNVAALTIQRGVLIPTDTEETLQSNGTSVSVASHVIADGSVDVGYVWTDGSYSYVLHVNLRGPITRPVADRLALSIR